MNQSWGQAIYHINGCNFLYLSIGLEIKQSVLSLQHGPLWILVLVKILGAKGICLISEDDK